MVCFVNTSFHPAEAESKMHRFGLGDAVLPPTAVWRVISFIDLRLFVQSMQLEDNASESLK